MKSIDNVVSEQDQKRISDQLQADPETKLVLMGEHKRTLLSVVIWSLVILTLANFDFQKALIAVITLFSFKYFWCLYQQQKYIKQGLDEHFLELQTTKQAGDL